MTWDDHLPRVEPVEPTPVRKVDFRIDGKHRISACVNRVVEYLNNELGKHWTGTPGAFYAECERLMGETLRSLATNLVLVEWVPRKRASTEDDPLPEAVPIVFERPEPEVPEAVREAGAPFRGRVEGGAVILSERGAQPQQPNDIVDLSAVSAFAGSADTTEDVTPTERPSTLTPEQQAKLAKGDTE